MTKKFERMMEPVLREDGSVMPRVVHLSGGALLKVLTARDRLWLLRIDVPELWFTRRALEELIAELLFLKEEWDNHPIVLEQEQEEDMEEIHDDFEEEDNPFDEDEEEVEPREEIFDPILNVRWIPNRGRV